MSLRVVIDVFIERLERRSPPSEPPDAGRGGRL
jgi:hypothetical protein